MALVRVVSSDEWNNMELTRAEWMKLRLLYWRDPAYQEILKGMAHKRQLCPVIRQWVQAFFEKKVS